MKYDDSDEKLRDASKLFEDAVDHYAESHREAHRASRFYHNSECEGQWEADDLSYLRENGRIALSFNIIKSKIDTFLGMYADAQRLPKVAAASGSDQLMADVLDAVKDQVLQDANHERLSARQLKTGTITGECALHIEVEPSEDGDEWVQVNLYRVLPFEFHWDIASVEPDRSDAGYVFWDRWLSKTEFKAAYPDHADKWDELKTRGQSYDDLSSMNEWGEAGSTGDIWKDDYGSGDGDRYYRYYYDRQKNKVRVIRYEYVTRVRKYYAQDTQSGEKMEIDKAARDRVEAAQQLGMPIKLIERDEEVVEVCEFAGSVMLREYDSAGPFSGFSLVPYCYEVDEETGTAYGLVRNLFDPQMELNKSKSLEIEHIAQSVATGTLAEEDQIADEQAFTNQRRQPGGVAIVKRDALAEGRVRENMVTPPNAAVMARTASSMELLNEVSTIPSAANLTAAEHAQAGVTVAIRYHKSRQAVSDPFSHFEDAQKVLVQKVVEIICNAMPDDQIAEILGDGSQYIVQQGFVIEMGPSPDGSGQMVPVARASLRGMRGKRWNLDMEYASENSTLRMLELDMLMQLAAAGVPVDPELMVERASNSRAERERLKAYVEKAQKAQAEGQAAQARALEAQTQQYAQIEAAKVQETQRHNQAQESLTLSDQQIKERLGLLDKYIQAEEGEKERMFEVAKFAMQQRTSAQGASY